MKKAKSRLSTCHRCRKGRACAQRLSQLAIRIELRASHTSEMLSQRSLMTAGLFNPFQIRPSLRRGALECAARCPEGPTCLLLSSLTAPGQGLLPCCLPAPVRSLPETSAWPPTLTHDGAHRLLRPSRFWALQSFPLAWNVLLLGPGSAPPESLPPFLQRAQKEPLVSP